MLLAVGPGVLQLEPLGQVDIHLHGGQLPRAADRVLGLQVDLGAVERRLPRHLGDLQATGVRDVAQRIGRVLPERSEEHTSELQSLMRISYAVFCLKKKKNLIK